MKELMSRLLSSKVAVLVGSWFSVTGIIWKLCERIDKTVSDQARQQTAAWLKNVDATVPVRVIAQTFTHAFDAVFGKRHWSWRCFSVSCVASTIVFILAACVRWTGTVSELFSNPTEGLALIPYAAMWNFIPDYISLLKSRKILEKMSNVSGVKFGVLLITDVVISILIAMVTLVIYLCWLVISLSRDDDSKTVVLTSAMERLIYGAGGVIMFTYIGLTQPVDALGEGAFGLPMQIYGLVLWTTLMTTGWVVMYAISAGLLKVIPRFAKMIGFTKWFLDIDRHPYLSIGVVAIGLLSVAYVGYAVTQML